MCIAFWQAAPADGPALVLAFNRDEFLQRPTRGFHVWDAHPGVCAPLDMAPPPAERGSWIGVSRRGLLALLTNYREPAAPCAATSRGALVRGLLVDPVATPGGQRVAERDSAATLRAYAHAVYRERARYSGFNLVLFDLLSPRGDAWYVANRGGPDGSGAVRPLDFRRPAGLSNSTLDQPWPKVTRGLRIFSAALASTASTAAPAAAGDDDKDRRLIRAVARAMRDCSPFDRSPPRCVDDLRQCIFVPRLPDGTPDLPAAGGYGTRTTDVLLLRGHELTIAEYDHDHDSDSPDPTTLLRFRLDAATATPTPTKT